MPVSALDQHTAGYPALAEFLLNLLCQNLACGSVHHALRMPDFPTKCRTLPLSENCLYAGRHGRKQPGHGAPAPR